MYRGGKIVPKFPYRKKLFGGILPHKTTSKECILFKKQALKTFKSTLQ